MFISGPGRTGKSYLIEAISSFVRFHYGRTGGRHGLVVIMAPTGVFA